MIRRCFTLGTRQSRLALYQANLVAELIARTRPDMDVEIAPFESSGDRMLSVPAPQLAADAFTDTIERALSAREIDAAVHSLKDLPLDATAGLIVAAVPMRADPREALVCANGCTLAQLPVGSVVGTSSERRAAAVLRLRPDLKVRTIRGAVEVRVAMVLNGEYDAALLALAGLQRLGLLDNVTDIFDLETMPPAAGQGALAVQCRSDDALTLGVLAAIDDITLHNAVDSELASSMRHLKS